MVRQINVENCCRICLNSKDLRSLFGYNKKKIMTLSDMVMECTSIHVAENDSFPQKICQKCVYEVNKFYKFRQLAKDTDLKLQEKLKSELNEEHKKLVNFEEDCFKIDFSPKHSSNESIFELRTTDNVKNFNETDEKYIKNDIKNEAPEFSPRCSDMENDIDTFATLEKQSLLERKLSKRILRKTKLRKKVRVRRVENESLGNTTIEAKKQLKNKQCDTCGKRLSCRTNLILHMRKHTGEKPFPCDVCGKCFARVEHVTIHKRTHTGERPFKCTICSKDFIQHGTLMTHLRTHTGERPHTCNVCGKSFTQSITLKYHMRTHTGETPFKCEICKKGFIHSGNLNIHMRFHSGERPHECTICSQRFVTRSHLSVHYKCHRGEKNHVCTVCNKAFIRKEHLRDHLLIHTGDRPHECTYCQKKYIQRSHLTRHLKLHKQTKNEKEKLENIENQ
ncbi:zinc finger protein 565-like [Chrysoperla carnea]|uniref:zinc finger protein 565-like n=1 Tax=Chrysoperla carnea TaxID=189513 RepID=UPI001D0885E3|nr:zinc finger protein 565-like [Chrysoperla carnea]